MVKPEIFTFELNLALKVTVNRPPPPPPPQKKKEKLDDPGLNGSIDHSYYWADKQRVDARTGGHTDRHGQRQYQKSKTGHGLKNNTHTPSPNYTVTLKATLNQFSMDMSHVAPPREDPIGGSFYHHDNLVESPHLKEQSLKQPIAGG